MERAIMRVLFALVVARHIPGGLSDATLSYPSGFARFVDLHFLVQPTALTAGGYMLWAALALYVFRFGLWLALPYMTLFSIAVGSAQNSSGAIGHHAQIVSLVLLAQTVAYFYSRARSRAGGERIRPDATESLMIDWSLQAIAATYFISGLTKLINTHGLWMIQSPLVAVQILKTSDHTYYDALDPTRHQAGYALAEWMVQHPLLVGIALSSGLLLELTSPLLLWGRRWAAFFGVALLVFHKSIGHTMQLHFPYNEMLLVIYLINVPFWIGAAVRWVRKFTPTQTPFTDA
ncbi:MAG: hypothetical protein M3Y69_01705 [Verrucomicrobiota bacterium]|nr:hypothetical protein [Verrucomicrobiota bacterium]